MNFFLGVNGNGLVSTHKIEQKFDKIPEQGDVISDFYSQKSSFYNFCFTTRIYLSKNNNQKEIVSEKHYEHLEKHIINICKKTSNLSSVHYKDDLLDDNTPIDGFYDFFKRHFFIQNTQDFSFDGDIETSYNDIMSILQSLSTREIVKNYGIIGAGIRALVSLYTLIWEELERPVATNDNFVVKHVDDEGNESVFDIVKSHSYLSRDITNM